METRRTVLFACLVAGAVVLTGGCGSSTPNEIDPAAAPLLGPAHFGYKSAYCDACHELPVAHHPAERWPACATCHGGNGACDPNGLYATRTHTAEDTCATCHEDPAPHGFASEVDCAACHFAAAGLDDTCGEPPGEPVDALRPESELVSGCFDWPGTEFTPDNHALLTLGLTAGAAAVDFTLRTPDGTPISLADLLLTRPVVLVTGGFT